MNNFKKHLTSNITLICVLAFSAIHLLLLTLNLFNVTKFSLPQNFSYITAYILMIFCFILYIFGFYIENLKILKIPTWFKIVFYVAFYIFTNVYYILGLYQNIIFMLLYVAYLAFILNICALAIHFNINKDEKNKLKTSTKVLLFNTTLYATSMCSVVLFLISIIKIIFFNTLIFSTLTNFVFEMATMLLVCIIISLILGLSHKKSKKILNGCLIKITEKPISPSIKKQ